MTLSALGTTIQEINILSQENNATFDYVFSSGEHIQSVALGNVITVELLYSLQWNLSIMGHVKVSCSSQR